MRAEVYWPQASFDAIAEFKPGNAPAPETGTVLGTLPGNFNPCGKAKLKTNIDAAENLGGTSYTYSREGGDVPLTFEMKGDWTIKAGTSRRNKACGAAFI